MKKWEAVGRLTYSPRKRKILRSINRPMTPTDISKVTGIKLSNTSDSLSQLVKMGLLEMVTPKDIRKGRLFRVTKKGKEAIKSLQ